MGGAVSAGEDNDELVDNLRAADYIKSSRVESVFRAIDRGNYYDDGSRRNAYKDLAWKNGNVHLSAPCVYSEVMESLELDIGLSFLNLGSGTGYLSTMAGLILGMNGRNHGIEIHPDVVEYAYAKLEEFKKLTSAIDQYEFCDPEFIVGNCLCIDPSAPKYDRVYCGAACPENYQDYMKKLIKVGGILVMPLNDQLLQITRSSEKTWVSKTMLPVSFASLIAPEECVRNDIVQLPDHQPKMLQTICRDTIRRVIRNIVEIEHPELLVQKPKLQQSKKRERSKAEDMCRFVVPYPHDNEPSDPPYPDERATECERSGILFTVRREGSRQVASFIHLARAIARRERLLHTVSRRSTQELEVEDQPIADAQSEPQSMEVEASTDNGDASTSNNETGASRHPRAKADSGFEESDAQFAKLEESSDSETDEAIESDDSDFSDCSESCSPKANKRVRGNRKELTTGTITVSSISAKYRVYMEEKIKQFPLPMPLKSFLNYNRKY